MRHEKGFGSSRAWDEVGCVEGPLRGPSAISQKEKDVQNQGRELGLNPTH